MTGEAAVRESAGQVRHITREAGRRVAAYGTPEYQAVPWWTGVWGLDPRYDATQDVSFAASSAAIACAARALEIDQPYGLLRGRDERADEAHKWFEWLAEPTGGADASLRRLALRMMCDADIDPLNILPSAKLLHDACTITPPRRKR
jgi:hypothetical protein